MVFFNISWGNIRNFIKTLQAKQNASVRGIVEDCLLFADTAEKGKFRVLTLSHKVSHENKLPNQKLCW